VTEAKDKPKAKSRKVLFTAEQISTRIGEIARQINNDYADAELHVVGVLENGFVFMADLVRRLEMPVICQFVRPEFKETVQGETPTTEIFFGPDSEVRGQHVLLVEALIQSGVTSEFLIRNFLARGAASVKLAALLDKQTARRVSLQPDYFGFLLEETFVVGYGLGAPHVGRNLPYIGVSAV
jgi:hypoxanthine phosphoribosyltransferase